MQIVLHIGTDKTGTTAIQRHLVENRDWFLSKSVFIPLTGWGADNGHQQLLSTLEPSALRQLASELEQADAARYRIALLSWEGMTVFSGRQIAQLRSVLGEYDCSILIYLREQAEIIQTGFLQQLKSNKARYRMRVFESPQSFMEKLLSARVRHNWRRNYFRVLRRWQRHWPSAQFNVRIFSPERLLHGDVLHDFANQLGLTLDAGFNRIDLPINPSLDVESAIVVERRKTEGLPDEEIEKIIDIALSRIRQYGVSSKYFLSEKTAREIQRHFRRSNEKLARRFMQSGQSPFSQDKVCWREESLETIAARADSVAPQVDEILQVPTLLHAVQGDIVSQKVDLAEGWYAQANWGVWSCGPQSRLRFRLLRRAIDPDTRHILVKITGRYYGHNRLTGVTINGVDFGMRELLHTREDLRLPIDALLPFEIIDITLKHTDPITPREFAGVVDDRKIAFGITGVAFGYASAGDSSDRRVTPVQA